MFQRRGTDRLLLSVYFAGSRDRSRERNVNTILGMSVELDEAENPFVALLGLFEREETDASIMSITTD